MDKQSQILFFDKMAETWDSDYSYDPIKLRTLASLCEIKEGTHIINCACGTAPMTPFLLEYAPKQILGIDFAPKMTALAAKKFTDPRFEARCCDILEVTETGFDLAIICDAFQFFDNRGSLVRQLRHLLATGGRVMICCPEGRSNMNSYYQTSAPQLALPLPTAQTLAKSLEPYFDVDTLIDTAALYVVSGIAKAIQKNE